MKYKITQNGNTVKEGKLNLIGEGVVWTGYVDDIKHQFKTKGDKHSKSKVKELKYSPKKKSKNTK